MKIFKDILCKLFGHDYSYSYLKKQDHCNRCCKKYSYDEFNKDVSDFINKGKNKVKVNYSCKQLKKAIKNYSNSKEIDENTSIYSTTIPSPREGGFEKYMK